MTCPECAHEWSKSPVPVSAKARVWKDANGTILQDVAVPVLNAIEIGAQMVYIGFVKLIKYLLVGFDNVTIGLIKFYEILGKLPGRLGEPYREAAQNLEKFRENLQQLIKASDVEMSRVGEKISNTLSTGEGSLAQGYDKAKAAIKGFIDSLKGLGNEVNIQEVAQKFDALQSVAEGTARSVGSAFKHFFSDAFRGQLDDAKDYFAEFGNMMLDVLAEVFAKMIFFFTAELYTLLVYRIDEHCCCRYSPPSKVAGTIDNRCHTLKEITIP